MCRKSKSLIRQKLNVILDELVDVANEQGQDLANAGTKKEIAGLRKQLTESEVRRERLLEIARRCLDWCNNAKPLASIDRLRVDTEKAIAEGGE